jgi:tRNA-Thr(GGU) m(6)t(6)A37 methyltransferase TsaA
MGRLRGNSPLLITLSVNAGQTLAKLLAFVVTGASSMLAEAIHSIADSANEALLLIGNRRAQREATPQHPFGHGRERYLFAFIVSIAIFAVGGVASLYEGLRKITSPQPITGWHWVPITVLLVGITLQSLAFRSAVLESNNMRGHRTWAQFIRHSRSPEPIVALLETSASMVGLVLALFGVGLTLLTGDGLWDGLGTAAIGTLLILVSTILWAELASLLVGEGASYDVIDAIERAIMDGPEADRIIHLRTLHLGPEELLVAAKIGFSRTGSAVNVARGIDSIQNRIRREAPIAKVIYLEPDIGSPDHIGEVRPEPGDAKHPSPFETPEYRTRAELDRPGPELATVHRQANSRMDTARQAPHRYELKPVAWVESPLKHQMQTPRQGREGAPPAWLVFEPEFAEAVRDLRAGEHVIVLTWLDRSRRDELSTAPADNPASQPLGVFSTRSPDRPNPVGLHRAQILAIEGLRILVSELEALDHTAVIDIKPALDTAAER